MKLTSEFVASVAFQNSNDLILLVDTSGLIVEANRTVEKVLGYSSHELSGSPLGLILPDCNSAVGNILEQTVTDTSANSNTNSEQYDSQFLSKAGQTIVLSCSYTALKDKDNELQAFLIVAQDNRLTKRLNEEIARREKVETDLRDANKRLEDLDKLKSDFLSSISHELRTPLTSILGFSVISKKKLNNIILPAVSTEDTKLSRALSTLVENTDIVISESKKLAEIINDLLDIAQIQAGKIDWKMVLISVTEIIDSALTKTKLLFEQKGLQLITEVSGELPKITGDKDRLTQVVTNLLSNAEKFTAEGSVTIKAVKSSNNIVVSITDTGVGIPQDDCPRIFDEFNQLGDTLTCKPPGLGLGLAICKQIVELHGGAVWVESEIGKGSTFYFSLPLD